MKNKNNPTFFLALFLSIQLALTTPTFALSKNESTPNSPQTETNVQKKYSIADVKKMEDKDYTNPESRRFKIERLVFTLAIIAGIVFGVKTSQ